TISDGNGATAISNTEVTVFDSSAITVDIGAVSIPPVAIDLDSDGVEFVSALDGITANAVGEEGGYSMAWVHSDDGVLIYDGNLNGEIDGLQEFAFATYSDDLSATDLEGLRFAFDSNDDGVLDSSDAEFDLFHVWQDADADGNASSAELITLSELQIESINLESDGVPYSAASGDVHVFGETAVTYLDGSVGIAADASFATEQLAEFEQADLLVIDESGNLVNLDEANAPEISVAVYDDGGEIGDSSSLRDELDRIMAETSPI
ncbi:MAG: hypothetical protein AAF226_07175, partial [Verrucomicrobiota bacterium]